MLSYKQQIFILENKIDAMNEGMIKMNAPMIYDLRKPKHVDPNKTYPALFLIHGIGSNEQNMFPLVEGLEEQFYIFSIRGPFRSHQALLISRLKDMENHTGTYLIKR